MNRLTRRLVPGASVCAAILSCTHAPAAAPPASPEVSQVSEPSREYAGLYFVTTQEDRFVACGVRDIGDGWALQFRHPDEARFIGPTTAIQGYGPITHFIRVRGALAPTGRYNRGFQTRQLTVDSVLDVKETPQPCESYEDLPQPWNGVPRKARYHGVALSDDRTLAAVMDDKGRISVWRTKGGELVKEFASQDKGDFSNWNRVPMVFSPDNKLLAVGGIDATVRIWNPSTGKRLYAFTRSDSLPGYNDVAQRAMAVTRDLAFDNSGTLVAATNGVSSLIWSLTTREPVAQFNRGRGSFSKVFFLADGGLLVAGDTGIIRRYPRPGADPVWEGKLGVRVSQYAARSPDQRWLAVNAWGDSIYLWSVSSGARGPVLPVPSTFGGDGAMAFSADGRMIATSGGSGGLYVWDVRTGAPIRSFHGFPGPVRYAWFLPDGKSIVTYSLFDDQLRIVNLEHDKLAGPNPQPDSVTNPVVTPAPPRTISGVVTGPNKRAVAGAEALLSNGDAPDVVLQRTTTSYGGYLSFDGVRFPHVPVRVRKQGFEEGIVYIHQRRWDMGQFGLELKASAGGSQSPPPSN